MRNEAPNPKFQISNKLQKAKRKKVRKARLVSAFGVFSVLSFVWDLEFGIWKFVR
jgi:hypothetical protein